MKADGISQMSKQRNEPTPFRLTHTDTGRCIVASERQSTVVTLEHPIPS